MTCTCELYGVCWACKRPVHLGFALFCQQRNRLTPIHIFASLVIRNKKGIDMVDTFCLAVREDSHIRNVSTIRLGSELLGFSHGGR